MKKTTEISAKELKAKVERRKRLVSKIIKFAQEITTKGGKVTEKKVHDAHTYEKRELKDFGGFNFFWRTGLSMMGGDSVDIHFNEKEVFSVEWWSMDNIKVLVFDNNKEWQTSFGNVIKNKDEIAAQIDKKEKRRQKKEEQETKNKKLRRQLSFEAERLKI